MAPDDTQLNEQDLAELLKLLQDAKSDTDKDSAKIRKIDETSRNDGQLPVHLQLVEDLYGKLFSNQVIPKLLFEVYRHVPMEEMPGAVTYSGASRKLTGLPSEVKRSVNETFIGKDHYFATDYLTTVVANTLQQWEEEEDVDIDDRIDVVVQPLIHNNILPVSSVAAVQFAAGLESILNAEREKPLRTYDCQTWGAIADWMRKVVKGEQCRQWAVIAYLSIIQSVLTDADRLSGTEKNELLQLAAADANSLASTLDDLGTGGEKTRKMMNLIHWVHLLLPEDGQDKDTPETTLTTIFRTLQIDRYSSAESTKDKAVLLAQLIKIPLAWSRLCNPLLAEVEGAEADYASSWRYESYERQALLEISAALVRMCLADEDSYDEPPSSFFNVSVSLLKSSKSEDQAFVSARIATTSIGLWCALVTADNLDQAWDEYHGLQCLINMLGGIVKLSDNRVSPEVLSKLASAALPFAEDEARIRLQNAIKKLNLTLEINELGLQGCRTAVEQIIASHAIGSDLPVAEIAEQLQCYNRESFCRAAAEFWAPLFHTQFVRMLGKEEYHRHSSAISDLLEVLTKSRKEDRLKTARVLLALYTDYRKFFKDAGADLSEEIAVLIDSCRMNPPQSLAQFVREYAPKALLGNKAEKHKL